MDRASAELADKVSEENQRRVEEMNQVMDEMKTFVSAPWLGRRVCLPAHGHDIKHCQVWKLRIMLLYIQGTQ